MLKEMRIFIQRMERTVDQEQIWRERSREILSAYGREDPRGTAYGIGDRRGLTYGREEPRGSGYSRGDPWGSTYSRGDSRVIGSDVRPNPVVVNQLVGAILKVAGGVHQNRQIHGNIFPLV